MMTKKTETTETEEKVNFDDTARPIAGQTNKPIDRETASHQWQAGSPAVNASVISELPAQESVLSKIDSPENIKAREEAAKLAEFVFNDEDDCSKRDVSDPQYCQPGSERHKAYLKKK